MDQIHLESKMNRRQFLRRAGAVVGAAAAAPVLTSAPFLDPASRMAAKMAGRWVKVSGEGDILVSKDLGETWVKSTGYPSPLKIHDLTQDGAWFYLRLECSGYPFTLKSSDAVTWYTLDWIMPG